MPCISENLIYIYGSNSIAKINYADSTECSK